MLNSKTPGKRIKPSGGSTRPMQVSQVGHQENLKEQHRKEKKHTPRRTTNKPINRSHIVIPYVPGICKSIKKIGKKHGVAVYFKGGRTLKNILVSPKDKDEMVNKNSVIYSYCCGEIDCDEEYIGESGRTFGEI